MKVHILSIDYLGWVWGCRKYRKRQEKRRYKKVFK